jgi:NAD(P)H-dependent FMN reductase
MAALEAADGVAIGSPNYYSYPSGLIKHFFDLALNRASLKGKPLVAFSTHGGGGGVATIIEQLGQSAGMKVVAPGSDSANAPKGDEIKAFRKIGQVLAVAASS